VCVILKLLQKSHSDAEGSAGKAKSAETSLMLCVPMASHLLLNFCSGSLKNVSKNNSILSGTVRENKPLVLVKVLAEKLLNFISTLSFPTEKMYKT